MQSQYDQYESGGDGYEETPELIITTYSTVTAEVSRAFGTESEWGQSFGVNWSDVVIEDGLLYADPEKEKYKLFSWQDANDLSPAERYDHDGDDPTVDDAPDVLRKSYFNTDKTYELVAARQPELTDDDGNVVLEAESKERDLEFDGDGGVETGDYEYLDGDTIEAGDFTTWYSANDDNVPVSSTVVADTLSEYGDNTTNDTDDAFDWLTDTTGDNILREDLEGRRIRYFVVVRPGENFNYNLPIIQDAETEAQIQPDNRAGGTGNSDSGVEESDAVQKAAELDEGSYPEPIADFLSSGERLDLTEDRARNLLTDLIQDDENSLTSEMVTDYGGREVLVNQVI